MSRRWIGIALAIVGVVIAIVSIAADAIGLSGSGSSGWGNRQTAGLVVGSVLVAAGAVAAFRRSSSS